MLKYIVHVGSNTRFKSIYKCILIRIPSPLVVEVVGELVGGHLGQPVQLYSGTGIYKGILMYTICTCEVMSISEMY